jgi:hypothetical protein
MKERHETDLRFLKSQKSYHRQLDKLENRLPRNAWKFFKLGFAETSLHDGVPLSLSLGDGLDYETAQTQAI